MAAPTPINPRAWQRWWIYQRERFPLFVHGPLIAASSFSTLSFSRLVRGATGGIDSWVVVAAFVVSFVLFLQLRIADEYKDDEDDRRYRPYRPVPRGLVKLGQLGVIALGAAPLQLALLFWLRPGMLFFLFLTWGYLALMTYEFLVPEWLRAHPVLYMLSHMMIMPLIDLLVSACDWFVHGASSPPGLLLLLGVSFGNGVIVEIGRKIRAPADEEEGVETYSKLWGGRRAAVIWLTVVAVTASVALLALWQIGFLLQGASVLGVLLAFTALQIVRFNRRQLTVRALWIERAAGFWVMGSYLTLGALPLVWQWVTGG